MFEVFKSGQAPVPVTTASSSSTRDAQPLRGPQRIVLLCDGTWQSRRSVRTSISPGGAPTASLASDKYFTNVALLSQAIAASSSTRQADGTVMPQIVAYQSGIGSSVDLISTLIQGATGLTLGQKVAEAYGFLVDNYLPGDEVFLFGFSRGAYTARTIAGFINYGGIMDKRVYANGFMDILKAYMARDPQDVKTEDEAERIFYEKTGLWPSGNAMRTARGNESAVVKLANGGVDDPIEDEKEQDRQVDEKNKYPRVYPPQIRVVGVWDTVGALGIPGHFLNPSLARFFSFFDPVLAPNVSYAFQALGLCEDRKDFAPTLFFQPPAGAEVPSDEARRKGQVLKQVWFQGSHSDIGGSHPWHGLSDITLAWMVSQLMDQPGGPLLNVNLDALKQLQDRRRAWACQPEHPSRLCIEFQETRQVGQWPLLAVNKATPPPSSTTEDKTKSSSSSSDSSSLPWWWTNVVKSSGTTNEEIHYSVHIGNRYTKETSPQFDALRKAAASKPATSTTTTGAETGSTTASPPSTGAGSTAPQVSQLDAIWSKNLSPSSLGPTERILRWKDAQPSCPVDSEYLGDDEDAGVGNGEYDDDLDHTGEPPTPDEGSSATPATSPKPTPKPKQSGSDKAWKVALDIAEAPIVAIAFVVNLGPTPNRNLKPGLLAKGVLKLQKWASSNSKKKSSSNSSSNGKVQKTTKEKKNKVAAEALLPK